MNLDPAQQALRCDRSALVSELKNAGATFKGSKTCTCPFHDDKHPSAEVKQHSDGHYLFICYVCMLYLDVFDVRAKHRGCDVGDALKEVREVSTPAPVVQKYRSLEAILAGYPKAEATYKYTNPETKAVELAVIRLVVDGKKKFLQCSPNGEGWVMKRPQGKMPLYNRCRIADCGAVVAVEGEKAVHALADVGIVATTSPMGAGKAKEADWSPLAGKTVHLWPDNDPVDEKTGVSTGEAHMRDVQAILEGLNCKLYWIDNRSLGLPPKGDAFDFLKACQGTREDKAIAVKLVLDEARGVDIAGELEAKLALIVDGQWRNLAWPWPELTEIAQALLPGTLTAVCGDAGATKSFFMLQAFWHWHVAGEKVALFELEDTRDYHLQRVLAQLEQCSSLTDSLWIQNNPGKALEHFNRQRDILSSFGKCLTAAADRTVSHDEILAWLEQQCQSGATVLGIDPITAAEPNGKPWIEDQKFVFKAKEIMSRHKARLIYVIHPRISNGKLGPGLSSMAGGAAYPRFSHSALWLTREDDGPINGMVSRLNEKHMATWNRTLKITKARNGTGAGFTLALFFEPESLCFREVGVVLPEEKKERKGKRKLSYDDGEDS